jgi:hypothetical protein
MHPIVIVDRFDARQIDMIARIPPVRSYVSGDARLGVETGRCVVRGPKSHHSAFRALGLLEAMAVYDGTRDVCSATCWNSETDPHDSQTTHKYVRSM